MRIRRWKTLPQDKLVIEGYCGKGDSPEGKGMYK